MVGLEAFLTADAVSPGQVLLQIPDGVVTRLPSDALRNEVGRRGALYELLGLYAQAVIAHIMQLGACNALHTAQERCARWLLSTQDRVHCGEFRLSQEFLATMLGARRPTVTVVARTLQHAGLITYNRGRMRIEDRAGLEAASCPCYAVIRRLFDGLLEQFAQRAY